MVSKYTLFLQGLLPIKFVHWMFMWIFISLFQIISAASVYEMTTQTTFSTVPSFAKGDSGYLVFIFCVSFCFWRFGLACVDYLIVLKFQGHWTKLGLKKHPISHYQITELFVISSSSYEILWACLFTEYFCGYWQPLYTYYTYAVLKKNIIKQIFVFNST